MRVYSGWAHITRAEDVAGCWVIYTPDFDLMSQGQSPQHALEMIRDAVQICVESDLKEGFDPFGRRSNREQDWAPLKAIFSAHKKKLSATQMNEEAADFTQFAVQFSVIVEEASLVETEAPFEPPITFLADRAA